MKTLDESGYRVAITCLEAVVDPLLCFYPRRTPVLQLTVLTRAAIACTRSSVSPFFPVGVVAVTAVSSRSQKTTKIHVSYFSGSKQNNNLRSLFFAFLNRRSESSKKPLRTCGILSFFKSESFGCRRHMPTGLAREVCKPSSRELFG